MNNLLGGLSNGARLEQGNREPVISIGGSDGVRFSPLVGSRSDAWLLWRSPPTSEGWEVWAGGEPLVSPGYGGARPDWRHTSRQSGRHVTAAGEARASPSNWTLPHPNEPAYDTLTMATRPPHSRSRRRPISKPIEAPLHERNEQAEPGARTFWSGSTVADLAIAQGAQPVADPTELRADLWPEDESLDSFVEAIYESRRLGVA